MKTDIPLATQKKPLSLATYPTNDITQQLHHHNLPNKPLRLSAGLVACISLALVGCGGDDNSELGSQSDATPSRNVHLVDEPVITKTFSADELKAAITAAGYDMIDTPVCGITVQAINHTTYGVAGEPTTATGAVITPSGDNEKCQGERPINLYAHGTNADKNYNMAALDDPSNPAYAKALYVAASYAGQGDILIAPNYPGYGDSNLDYIPYNTAKQGEQMLDALTAGKLAIDASNAASKKPMNTQVSYGDKLFLTGFSQGGYVTMATAKLLDEAGTPATAISPSSGAYAITAFADSIISGNVISGGTIFLPMLGDSYRKEYRSNDDAGSPFDGIYSAKYVDIPDLFPTDGSVNALLTTGKLPLTELFQSSPTGYESLDPISPPNPMMAYGFGESNYLFSTEFRAQYIEDMKKHPDGIFPTFSQGGALPNTTDNAVRQAFIDNDLRNYQPTMPVLMCGGNQDPSVTFDVNSMAQASIWKQNPKVNFALLDVDITNRDARTTQGKLAYISTLPTTIDNTIRTAADTLQAGFLSKLQTLLGNYYQAAYANALTEGKSEEEAKLAGQTASYQALLYNYHGAVDDYCVSAANTFFEQYR